MPAHDTLIVLDFGSQYAQLIARRLREAGVYAELFPWNAPAEEVLALRPKGFVLSGGPASVYEPGAPQVPKYVWESGQPVLGICYGMQALTHALGGKVAPAPQKEYGPATLHLLRPNPLIPPGEHRVWMSHGDRIETLPPGFVTLARTANSPIAAMGDLKRRYFGVQFHPEVHHTPIGREMLRRFAVDICGAQPTWTPANIIAESVEAIRAQVGDALVLAAVSGGVDSTVAAALVHRAVGDQLTAVFVDTGLLRANEREQVEQALREQMHIRLMVVDAAEEFFTALRGVTDPEEKRRIIGETFIRVFERTARQVGEPPFLVQGTIYPDVIESRAPERAQAAHIKSHHNVGGLPPDMRFELVEPLRYLFKDEVRRIGEALGLPKSLVWRQPFPGPGLAVRCLGEITPQRLARLRAADAIFTTELAQAGFFRQRAEDPEESFVAQAFAVLLPVRSVGVMGDYRTYDEVIALRAVTTSDFMTADWARLPHDLLAKVASRIVNEVDGVNRVVYDITSKPPGTIEWE
ncbi:MAG TPA: glutamine-hydrolyzing GMP synthase [Anaerolineae bacterium]|nr:glutamine-hydrolyzing GMP synthase [Anaerolineae bacterium]HID85390.1 glutamine-hydrolyzing GMP synthase [Anaerolineales bacterium]HIQ09388.1 glutamine-hydrolyzing GMP synthase [Anaerolineaceae bacterium]